MIHGKITQADAGQLRADDIDMKKIFNGKEVNIAPFVDLRGAVLRDADLRGAYLRGADLSDADLRSADFSGADLRGAVLRDADFSGADFSCAVLRDADLRGADLRGAYLRDAYLRGAYLRGADLSDADLRGADLSDADLSSARISNCVGNGKEFISAQLNQYNIVICDDLICIGWESHRAHDWNDYDDKRIIEMDGENFLRWWRKNKSTVFSIYNSIDIK